MLPDPRGGAAAAILVPNAMQLRGWSDVMASGAVSIGGGIAVKQLDKGAEDAFMLTGLGVTGHKAVRERKKNSPRMEPAGLHTCAARYWPE